MKYLFIFTAHTNYGELVRCIVHNSVGEAHEYSSSSYKSLNKLGWGLTAEVQIPVDKSVEIGVVFDGGGDM